MKMISLFTWLKNYENDFAGTFYTKMMLNVASSYIILLLINSLNILN